MNFVHLKYLLAVEKYESISKAASHLYINQPHLSKIIKEMEEEVNIKIFERHNKGVVPTKKGAQFLLQAKKIVQEVDYLENMYQEDTDKIYLDLAVPRASYISKAFTDYLNASHILEKQIKINYRETNSIDAIQRIYNGDNNLGIIRFPKRDRDYYLNILQLKELEFEELFEFEYLVLMSKENKLADKKVYVNDLKNQLELIHGDISIPEAMELSENKKEINIYERSIQFELLMNLKNSYMWVSPMPQKTLQCFHLITKKCEDKHIEYVDFLIYRKGYTLTKEDQRFIQFIKEVIVTL